MNKIQLYEDLGSILYILSDYVAEESEQYIKNPMVRKVLERAFSEIEEIYEGLEEGGNLYTMNPLELITA